MRLPNTGTRRAGLALLAAVVLAPFVVLSKDDEEPPPPMPQAEDLAVAAELNALSLLDDTDRAAALLRAQLEKRLDSEWEPETWRAFWEACSLPSAATDFLSDFLTECSDGRRACPVLIELARLLRAQGRFADAERTLSPRPGTGAAWVEFLQAEAEDTRQTRFALSMHELPLFDDHKSVLNRIRRRFEIGQQREAIAEITKVIADCEDRFVDDGEGKLVEALDVVLGQLADWPAGLRDPVLTARRRDAERVVADAAVSRAFRRSAWRRYHRLPSVQARLGTEAEQFLERGEFGAAANRYAQLDGVRRDPALAVRYAFALAQSDGADAAASFVQSLPDNVAEATVTVGGERAPLRATVADWKRDLAPLHAARTFPTGDLPYAVELTVRDPLRLKKPSMRVRPEKPDIFYSYPTMLPLEKDDRIYLNAGTTLHAIDVSQGVSAWRFRPAPANKDWDWDQRNARQYPVEHLGVVCGPRDTLFARMATSLRKEAAYCLRLGLFATDASSGHRLWSTRSGDLEEHHVLSEPAFYRDTLYVLTARQDAGQTTCCAVALDPETGDLLWTRPVAIGTIQYGAPTNYFQPPAPVGTSSGVVFCTPLGSIACLDSLTGRVQWITAYPRVSPLDAGRSEFATQPQTAGDVLVCTPRDSHDAFAIDLATGEIAWLHPRLWSEALAACRGGRALLVGQKITELDTKTGNVVRQSLPVRPVANAVFTDAGAEIWVSGEGVSLVVSVDDLSVRQAPDTGSVEGSERSLPLGRFTAVRSGMDWRFMTGDAEAFAPGVASLLECRGLLRQGRDADAATLAQRPAQDIPQREQQAELSVAHALATSHTQPDVAPRLATDLGKLFPEVAPVAVPWGAIRPTRFAFALRRTPATSGMPAELPPLTHDARPRLLWHCPTSGAAMPNTHRGVLLTWTDEEAALSRLDGFGEPLWISKLPPMPLASKEPRKREPNTVDNVLWCTDKVLLHNPFYITALRIDTGEPVWCCETPTDDFWRARLIAVHGARVFFTEGKRTVLRSVDLSTGDSVQTIPAAEGVQIGGIWQDDERLLLYTRNGDGDWQIRRIDDDGKPGDTIREGPKQTWPMHVEPGMLHIHRREPAADFLRAEDLRAGNVLWDTKFPDPIDTSPLRVLSPNGDRSWLRLRPFESHDYGIVVDGKTGEILIRSKEHELHVVDGMFFVVRRGRKALELGRAEADILQFVDGALDGGLDDTVSSVPEDFAMKWSHEEPQWEPYASSVTGLRGMVMVVAHAERWLHTFGFDAQTGKRVFTTPLIPLAKASSVKDISWHYGCRYLLVDTPDRRYCFTMTDDKTPLDSWVQDRLTAAGKTLAPSELPAAREAVYLAGSRPGKGGIDMWKPQEERLSLTDPGQWKGRTDSSGATLGRWLGGADASATVNLRIERESVTLSAVVRDSRFTPFHSPEQGDQIVIRLSRPDGTCRLHVGLNPNGFPSIQTVPTDPALLRNTQAVVSFAEGATLYDVRIELNPTNVLGSKWDNDRNAYSGAIGIEVADDDGDGVKGALAWPPSLPVGTVLYSRLTRTP